jgi:hypothetical protein
MQRNRRYLALWAVIVYGCLLLVGSIALNFYVSSVITRGTQDALALDGGAGYVSSTPCKSAITWNAALDRRVMSVSDTQVLTVTIVNKAKTVTCDEEIDIAALTFNLSPNGSKTAIVPPLSSRKLQWVLEPTQLGTFEIIVANSSIEDEQDLGVTITNIFGLTIWQAQLLSYIGTFLGTFLGPILTVTWFYERWKEYKEHKKSTNAQITSPVTLTNASASTPPVVPTNVPPTAPPKAQP